MVIDRGREGGHGDAVAYVLGALDPAARTRFEAHAATCADCLRELDELRPVADQLGLAAPQVQPPGHLATQLLTRARALTSAERRVAPEPPSQVAWPVSPAVVAAQQQAAARRTWWQLGERLAAPLAAAALFIALVSGGFTAAGRQEAQQTATAAAELAETLSIMYQPGRVAKLLWGAEASPTAEGMIYLVPDGTEAVVVAYNLPRLSRQEVYQFWLNNPEEDRRVSGGVFQVNERGRGHLIVRAPTAFTKFRSCGVTREPAKGSPKPTGPRVLSGNL
ncbi:MAG: anti-sigma factor domain-containing protein [Chloroflexota bacterium]